jgi:small Trp-rich protein
MWVRRSPHRGKRARTAGFNRALTTAILQRPSPGTIDRYILSQYALCEGVFMPLIIIIVALALLRYFEIGPVADLSWWWIVGLFGLAFLWFEFLEKLLGLDKRKADQQTEKARKDRIRKTFQK